MKYCDEQSPPKEKECTWNKKNNEAYYIALIQGLGTTREYGSNGIVVFTNTKLVCNKIKGIYQVENERLKQLHGEEKNIVSQFQSFRIRHCENDNRMGQCQFNIFV